MFDDYKPGSSLTLVKNPNWDPATDPGRIQTVDKWVFDFGEDTAKLENAILSDTGEGQTTITYDNVTPPTYKKVEADDPDRLVVGTSPCTYMWYLDMTKITDINVRKAIGYAYPYLDAWKAAGEIVGLTRVPSTSILPPGTAGRVDYDVLGIKGQNTDPEKSKELLQQAGAMGYEIKFLYATDDPQSVAAKDQIIKGLEAGGFTATPIASTSAKIRDERADPDSPINVRSSGWCSDWPSGGSWFPAQWDGALVGLAGMPNQANFKEAGRRRDAEGDPGRRRRRGGGRLGRARQVHRGDLLPGRHRRVRRHRDAPRLQGRRDVQRQRPRLPDPVADVRHAVARGRPAENSGPAATVECD